MTVRAWSETSSAAADEDEDRRRAPSTVAAAAAAILATAVATPALRCDALLRLKRFCDEAITREKEKENRIALFFVGEVFSRS